MEFSDLEEYLKSLDEDVPDVLREPLDIVLEIALDPRRGGFQQVKAELGGVVEALTGGTVQHHPTHGRVGLGRELGKLRQNGLLGWFQQAVQASEDGEGQDDLPIVRRLVIALSRSATDQMKAESD